MENAERGVVVAGNGDNLRVGEHAYVEPDEEPMLCDSSCSQVATKWLYGRKESRPRLHMPPPIPRIGLVPVGDALRFNLLDRIGERRLIQRRLVLTHRPAEVDDP